MVIHFNARSIRANFENTKSFLKTLQKSYHVIAITESWLDAKDNMNDYQLDNYDIVYTHRKVKREGGVMLYVNKGLEFAKIDKYSSVINDILESVTVEIILRNNKISYYLVFIGHRAQKYTSLLNTWNNFKSN